MGTGGRINNIWTKNYPKFASVMTIYSSPEPSVASLPIDRLDPCGVPCWTSSLFCFADAVYGCIWKWMNIPKINNLHQFAHRWTWIKITKLYNLLMDFCAFSHAFQDNASFTPSCRLPRQRHTQWAWRWGRRWLFGRRLPRCHVVPDVWLSWHIT